MEFAFTSLHFADPKSCRFRFRLDGYHRPGTWHEAGDRRVAYFTNLDPGTYAFQVQAASRLSDWSAVPATFRFSLQAHYWQTWPFRIAPGAGRDRVRSRARFLAGTGTSSTGPAEARKDRAQRAPRSGAGPA
jgi:hypothetical protein